MTDLRARSRGDQYRFKDIIKTKLLTRNGKALLLCPRNPYMAWHAEPCNSIPSTLPHSHQGFTLAALFFLDLPLNEMLFPCLLVWLAHPIIQTSVCCCCCCLFLFFIRCISNQAIMLSGEIFEAFPLIFRKKKVKNIHHHHHYFIFVQVLAKRNKI